MTSVAELGVPDSGGRARAPHHPLLPSPALTRSLISLNLPSESAPVHDSDAEGDSHRTSTFRLTDCTSHPSRADNVDDLHRLQKSVTKARHDGKGENGEEWMDGRAFYFLSPTFLSLSHSSDRRCPRADNRVPVRDPQVVGPGVSYF